MHTDSALAPTGHFLLKVFRRGLLVPELCMDERNLIVDGSKTLLAHLLGGDVATRSVTTIGFGTSGSAPAGSDTALTGSFTKAIDAHSYPATNQVEFDFSLASGENNGMAILEFGLITAGGALFARRNRSVALNKDNTISFSGAWVISF